MASTSSKNTHTPVYHPPQNVALMTALGKLIDVCKLVLTHYVKGDYVEGVELTHAMGVQTRLEKYSQAYSKTRDASECHTGVFDKVYENNKKAIIEETLDNFDWLKKQNIVVEFIKGGTYNIHLSEIYNIANDIQVLRTSELLHLTDEEKKNVDELKWVNGIKLNLLRIFKTLAKTDEDVACITRKMVELEILLDIGTAPTPEATPGQFDLSGVTGLINQVAPGLVPSDFNVNELLSPQGPMGGIFKNVMSMVNDPEGMEKIKNTFGGMMSNFNIPTTAPERKDEGVAQIENGVADVKVV